MDECAAVSVCQPPVLPLNTEHSCIQPGHSAPSPKEQGVSSPLVGKGISTAGPKGSKGLQSAAQ